MSVLKLNRGKKIFSSRITRWVDRLLSFDFEVVHAPERTLGMPNLLSRHPTEQLDSLVKAETLWKEWFTVNCVISRNIVLESSETSGEKEKLVKILNESNSVNRINNGVEKQPTRKRDKRISRETSKNQCSNTARTRMMSQSQSIKLLNE